MHSHILGATCCCGTKIAAVQMSTWLLLFCRGRLKHKCCVFRSSASSRKPAAEPQPIGLQTLVSMLCCRRQASSVCHCVRVQARQACHDAETMQPSCALPCGTVVSAQAPAAAVRSALYLVM